MDRCFHVSIMGDQVVFREFSEKFKEQFVALNLEWLQDLFEVEQHDLEVLQGCKEHVIDKGGHIILGLVGEKVVATLCFMSTKEDGVFELGKMCVAKELRGEGLGRKILEHSVQFGREQGWRRLVIYSCKCLHAALHLYTSAGFLQVTHPPPPGPRAQVQLEAGCPYRRADIKLQLEMGETTGQPSPSVKHG